jgi:RND family efflux transporter MFP subunit
MHARPIPPRLRALCGSRILAVLLLLLLAAAGLAGCGGERDDSTASADSTGATATDTSANGENAADTDGGESKTNEKAIRVNTGEVRRGDLVQPVYADGAIRTPQSVEIRTKVGGELVDVRVRDGDQVRTGQLIARIDPREYEIALEESRYRHLQALSQMAAEADTFEVDLDALKHYTDARTELDRLHAAGTLNRDEYRARLLQLEMDALEEGAFRQDVFQQRTGLAEARTAEERAKLNLEYTEIRAPFSGTVERLGVVIGEIVAVNAPICSIVNNDRLEAVVNVLEADLGNLVEGRPVRLAVPATGDTLLARVDVISPTLDASSRTCEVIIRFENDSGRYRPGMFVRAEIAGFVHPDLLMVPKAAVLIRDGRPLVFKRNGDRAQWLYVETGLENDNWVEIRNVFSGGSLEPGDEVVVSDHLTLAHEAKIRVRKRIPPLDRWAFASTQAGS